VILVGNSRGGAKGLALHLMKEENDHVELHELRGFASDNLMGALNETYAISRGTKCKQFLYSLSLNPPQLENVRVEDFETAIEQAETKLGLTDQPRAIVFHEKEGRRHAHVVWSRIDAQQMKAVQMSFDHRKLNTLSRELYLEHGWKMPLGLINSHERNPKNFTLAEWQQAKRIGQDPREIKTSIQDAWAISDTKAAFIHALEERGYKIARGDRRGFVAVDTYGEVYAIARQIGVKTKDVRARLGDAKALPSVKEAIASIGTEMTQTLTRFQTDISVKQQAQKQVFKQHRQTLVSQQRTERETFTTKTEQRRIDEAQQRQARFRNGFGGLWDRVRGEHKRIAEKNLREAQTAMQRDRNEKDQLIFKQLKQRRALQKHASQAKQHYRAQQQEITTDLSRYQVMQGTQRDTKQEALKQLRQEKQTAGPDGPRIRGPSLKH
jgi:hypothetical protein